MLVGGSTQAEGNVLINGEPVCDDSWDELDANVICRMLGYSSGLATTNSAYGSVNSEFIMDDVACTGNEMNIILCPHSSVDNCAASEGAGVICVPQGSFIITEGP